MNITFLRTFSSNAKHKEREKFLIKQTWQPCIAITREDHRKEKNVRTRNNLNLAPKKYEKTAKKQTRNGGINYYVANAQSRMKKIGGRKEKYVITYMKWKRYNHDPLSTLKI